MSQNMVMSIVKEALYVSMTVAGPILILTLIVGLFISIIQATTQIQEQTLTFLPKLLIVGLVLSFGGHWMLQQVVNFTIKIMNMISVING
ncbi:MAG: flagellar biosynthesis protein FliQ [Peptostreptococcaceae bacterium]